MSDIFVHVYFTGFCIAFLFMFLGVVVFMFYIFVRHDCWFLCFHIINAMSNRVRHTYIMLHIDCSSPRVLGDLVLRCIRVCVCACAHVFGQRLFLDFCVAIVVQNLCSPVGSAATST